MQTTERLSRLRVERDHARARLIELELEIASLVTGGIADLRSEIADAEERGDWPRAAHLRATCAIDAAPR